MGTFLKKIRNNVKKNVQFKEKLSLLNKKVENHLKFLEIDYYHVVMELRF